MCGRFTARLNELNKLLELYNAKNFDAWEEWEPRYNVAPTTMVPAIRSVVSKDGDDTQNEAVLLKWGLIPFWAKDAKIGSRMINARAETVATTPAFRSSFKRRRCLVAADGFYEWKKGTGKTKQPYLIEMKDGEPFVFAGLWDRWDKDGKPVESCTVITTTPNELMATIHDRMPVILPAKAADLWLDPAVEDAAVLQSLLVPFPAEEMRATPVSTFVNSVKNQGPKCAAAIYGDESQA